MKGKHVVVGAMVLALCAGVAYWLATPKALASGSSEKVDKLVDYLEGDAALTLKLTALETLRKLTDRGVEDGLEKIAKGSDTELAVFATTALGRKKTTAAKKKLKSLLENGKLEKDVRVGALMAIAVHWKDSGDLEYLESKTKSDTVLADRCAWVKKHIYKK